MSAVAEMEIPTVDPTPGPGDVTNFEQVKGGLPSVHPKLAPVPAAKTVPAVKPAAKVAAAPKEVQLDKPSDPNRANQIPEEDMAELHEMAEERTEGQRDKSKDKPAVEPEEAKAEAEEAKSGDETAKSEAEEANDKPDEATEEEIEKQVQAGKTLKEVRTAHKEVLKREWKLKSQLEQIQARQAEQESKAKEFDPETIKAERTELEASRKRLQEMEATVRTLDYTKSAEFHDKHVKPLAKAMETAFMDLAEMLVTEQDGTSRPATQGDFKALVQLPLAEATAKAKEMFGDLAPEVLAHRREVIKFKRAQQEAIEGAGKEAEAAHARHAEEQKQTVTKLTQARQQRTEELIKLHPHLFSHRKGDAESNKWFEKGMTLVNALDSGDLSVEQQVKIGAEVRMRAAAFPRVLFDLERTKNELNSLKAQIKGLQKSAPGEGDGSRGGPGEGKASDDMQDSYEELDRIARPVGRMG